MFLCRLCAHLFSFCESVPSVLLEQSVSGCLPVSGVLTVCRAVVWEIDTREILDWVTLFFFARTEFVKFGMSVCI